MTELTPEYGEAEASAPGGGPGYGKVVRSVVLGLRTVKGGKQLKLDPSIYDALVKEKVAAGDVIYIEASSGAVKRVGRCDAYATEFDLEAEEYVPLPKGDVHKRKEIVQDVTLHDLDSANARPQGGQARLIVLCAAAAAVLTRSPRAAAICLHASRVPRSAREGAQGSAQPSRHRL